MGRPVVVITRNLPPLTGGMERLTQQLVATLAGHYEVVVIGPPGCQQHVDAAACCIECRSAKAVPFLLEACWHALRVAAGRHKPLTLIAASGLTAPIALLAARVCGAPYITIVHGLDLVVEHALYQRCFMPAIRQATTVIANSTSTAAVAAAAGLDRARLRVVNPGVIWPLVLPPAGEFRRQHGIGKRPLVLSVGRLAARKGIAEFITDGLPAIIAAQPDVLFVIIGHEATDAIRVEHSVRSRVQFAIAMAGVADNVLLLGEASDDDIARAYRDADVFVFPLIPVAGDVEGFGMVAAEAAAFGLRTVAFDEGGVRDAIVAGVTGELVKGGDYQGFSCTVIEAIERRGDLKRRDECHTAAQRFSWERYRTEISAVIAAHVADAAPGGRAGAP